MKKILLLLLIFGLHDFCFSQIKFEPGAIIRNDGEKVECLIKNYDWLENPKSIKYKFTDNSEILEGSLLNLAGFEISNGPSYVRKKVFIDQSKLDISGIANSRNAELGEETIFLKQLIEGDGVRLFSYVSGQKRLFFYEFDQNKPVQLIYKRYYNVAQSKVGVNERYKQQLKDNFDCESITDKIISKTKYTSDHLIEFFFNYNRCSGLTSNITEAEDLEELPKNPFHLTLISGLRWNNFQFENSSGSSIIKSDNNNSFEISLDAEYFLGFNKKKWSLLAKSTYFQYSDEFIPSNGINLIQTATIDYKAIEFSFGGRHYIFLSDEHKIHLSAYMVYPLNIRLNFNNSNEEAASLSNFAAGIGYNYSKLHVYLNIQSGRTLFNSGRTNVYDSISLGMGYTLF